MKLFVSLMGESFLSGCPAIVVGISAGLASEGYGNKRL